MKLLRELRAMLAPLMLAGFAAIAAQVSAQAIPEIPIETLFRKTEYRSLNFSPDQKFMAALMPINSRYNLVIIDLEKRNANRVTNFDKADVLSFWWASNDRLLFTTGDEQQFVANAGDGGLFAVDRDGRNSRILIQPFTATPGQYVLRTTGYRGRIKDSKDEVLVESNDRSSDTIDIYRMNIFSGRKTLLTFDSPGLVNRWVLDRERVPRALLRQDPVTGVSEFMYRSAEGQPYKTLRQWRLDVKDIVIPLSFERSGKTMIVASNVGRDTMAFFRFDPETNQLGELIFGDDRYDVRSTDFNGGYSGINGTLRFSGNEEDDPDRVIGVSYQADRPKTVWFDETARKTQAMLDAALPAGNYNSWSPGEKRTLVLSRSDTDPGRYFIFDQDKKTLEDTGVRPRRWIDPKQMRPMQYVSWTAPDGMKIDGYLTLPASYSAGSPVPLVLHPHGGPWARDGWGFNPEVQFMANRGYAVLQPNFRGSVGYGRKHLIASFRQFGDTMIDDQLAGVDWAVREGFADKNRLAVYGASYGGYSTLMAIVKRPDTFKWAVNYVGISDMFSMYDTDRFVRYGKGGEAWFAYTIGNPKTDREAFERWSPARQLGKLQTPVFHAYGGEDRNVDIENGRVIRAAFDKAGKPQEWMFVADEAHGYRLDKNVIEYYTRFEAFMKKNMPRTK
jgi:dipeptidyl aminopeptidase/acylaminoacyl peptidase